MPDESHQKSLSLKRFLVAAAIWHVAFVLAIVLIGRTQLLPQTFDRDGVGVSFAIDSHWYRLEAEQLGKLVLEGKLRDWAAYKASFHVKLYSLSFALISLLVGTSIIGVEPLNLFYYLATLTLVYLLAREIFDRRVALFAAGAVGLWPSLLLHTTQLLRDPLFLAAMLLLILALVFSVNRWLTLKQGAGVTLAGSVGLLLVWLCRGDSWEVVCAIVLLGVLASAITQVKGRRFSPGATLAIATFVLLAAVIPRTVPTYRRSNEQLTKGTPSVATDVRGPLSRIGLLRHKFIARYPQAGSNIDIEKEVLTTQDIIRYLPRATLIGFAAPFPNMWFAKGAQVGFAGRFIAGLEMLLIYFFQVFCGVTLWKRPRRVDLWLLFGIAFVGCVALGYVVVNISTLYRMRYVYFMIVMILGMKSLLALWPAKSYGNDVEPQP